MGTIDAHLQRLLKMARTAKKDEADILETPFGFDARIVANWRALEENEPRELVRFVRRVALVAIAITVLGSAGIYRQLNENDELGEPLTNDYAIADSAIERQILQ
jgi:hypothetical protein